MNGMWELVRGQNTRTVKHADDDQKVSRWGHGEDGDAREDRPGRAWTAVEGP